MPQRPTPGASTGQHPEPQRQPPVPQRPTPGASQAKALAHCQPPGPLPPLEPIAGAPHGPIASLRCLKGQHPEPHRPNPWPIASPQAHGHPPASKATPQGSTGQTPGSQPPGPLPPPGPVPTPRASQTQPRGLPGQTPRLPANPRASSHHMGLRPSPGSQQRPKRPSLHTDQQPGPPQYVCLHDPGVPSPTSGRQAPTAAPPHLFQKPQAQSDHSSIACSPGSTKGTNPGCHSPAPHQIPQKPPVPYT